MGLCDDRRIVGVVDFAENTIDLNRVSTGAADELGLGRGFEPHSCLGAVLQGLCRFPGFGVKLIAAGLKCPVVRNRHMAVAALSAWPKEAWPVGLRDSLERAAESEPDDGVRDRMFKVLKGEPLAP
jgi:hypothetical protein